LPVDTEDEDFFCEDLGSAAAFGGVDLLVDPRDLDGVEALGEAKVILPAPDWPSFLDDFEAEPMCFSIGERRATLWLGDFIFAGNNTGSDI